MYKILIITSKRFFIAALMIAFVKLILTREV